MDNNQSERKYIVQKRLTHVVDTNERDIVFDQCIVAEGKNKRKNPELVMRYVKDGNTIHRPPAFDEKDMVKAFVKLLNSDIISQETKDLFRKEYFDNIKIK